ncbi:MAG: T9SS type A sorting domain-containing protein, partial [Sphingobacteriaceae bacterium]
AFYEIEKDLDGKGWKTIATVAGTGSVSHSASFANPENGINSYRVALYDRYFNQSLSPVTVFNAKETATIASFSAAGDSSKIKLVLSTSSEYLTNQFYIAKKTDSTDWAHLLTIATAGTTNAKQTYTAYDTSPVAGKNYYVIVYKKDGIETYSAVQVVDLAPVSVAALKQTDLTRPASASDNIVFSAYPNPTVDNIAFGLTNYTGKTINVTVTNVYGKAVANDVFTVNSSHYYILKNKVSPGTYIVNIKGDQLAKVTRVIVSGK